MGEIWLQEHFFFPCSNQTIVRMKRSKVSRLFLSDGLLSNDGDSLKKEVVDFF